MMLRWIERLEHELVARKESHLVGKTVASQAASLVVDLAILRVAMKEFHLADGKVGLLVELLVDELVGLMGIHLGVELVA